MVRKSWAGRLAEAAPAPAPAPEPVKGRPGGRIPIKATIPPYCLSLKDAGAYLGVSYDTILKLVQQREIPGVHLCERHLVRRVDLERMVDAQAAGGYHFLLPQTIAECRVASDQLGHEADQVSAHARKAQDPEVRDFLASAARAYHQLAIFYRWNAGLGEFAAGDEAERSIA